MNVKSYRQRRLHIKLVLVFNWMVALYSIGYTGNTPATAIYMFTNYYFNAQIVSLSAFTIGLLRITEHFFTLLNATLHLPESPRVELLFAIHAKTVVISKKINDLFSVFIIYDVIITFLFTTTRCYEIIRLGNKDKALTAIIAANISIYVVNLLLLTNVFSATEEEV
ncbi:unnamed protein product [Nesidiocoris tenuis]|uniref:Uncharacterized protein n=2 Tax=Nesidiocoris tenuis TaxID=355587 RepID=A0A6H5FW42_9HEMI|nr:unnamed protein product [Nesidiocoris tenuis]